jgi:hypothetical protein
LDIKNAIAGGEIKQKQMNESEFVEIAPIYTHHGIVGIPLYRRGNYMDQLYYR